MRLPPKVIFLLTFFFFFAIPNPLLAISPGDLVINEIMKDPDVVNDKYGEWFEIYNAATEEIDLRNLEIKDGNTSPNRFVIEGEEPIFIQPNNYFVFGCNDDLAQNGRLEVDYQYPYYLQNGFRFQLANGDDEIIILSGNTEIDRVEYDDGVNWPDLNGASMALLEPGVDNNDGGNWTTSTTSYGDGDLGTPGEANFPSPTPTPTSTPSSTPTPTLAATPTSMPPTPTSAPTPPQFPPLRFFKRILRHLFRFFPFLPLEL
jgi:hypothetical protein